MEFRGLFSCLASKFILKKLSAFIHVSEKVLIFQARYKKEVTLQLPVQGQRVTLVF